MTNQNLYTTATAVIAMLLLTSTLAFSSPRIDQVNTQGLEQGKTLTITGSGFFRESPDSYAVMFDMANKAYINGKLNTHQDTFEENQRVLRINKDPDTLWWKPTLSSNPALQDPSVVRSTEDRSFYDGAIYQLKGYNSFLGWPAAYGGFETPTDNSKLYVAWYLKVSYDPRYYWTVSPQSLQGQFIPGEEIKINGFNGKYIGIGTQSNGKDMLHFEITGAVNSNKLRGQQLTGNISGAKTIFPSKFASGKGIGYESPGSNKYLRVWEDPTGKDGIRISWTQMQVHEKWDWAPVTAGKWHLMEFMLDTDTNKINVYTDRKWTTSVDVNQQQIVGKWSPTIALLGFNGKIQEFQEAQIDDIYMDKSFARVVIGIKPKFSELDGYELQYPTDWSASKIKVKLNFGQIDPKTQSYLYVVNEDGSVNEDGFLLCEKCEAPPSKIKLGVD